MTAGKENIVSHVRWNEIENVYNVYIDKFSAGEVTGIFGWTWCLDPFRMCDAEEEGYEKRVLARSECAYAKVLQDVIMP